MRSASAEFKFWVNSNYVKLFEAGELANLREELPFRHVVIPNFLSEDGTNELLRQARNNPTEPAHGKGLAAETDWHWGAFAHLRFIRFYYGPELRIALNELMGVDLVMKKQAIPQLNIFKSGSKGIPIHTDRCEEVGIVSLLQLSEGWLPGSGGELVFYERRDDQLIKARTINPIAGTLILFEVNAKSYHGVQDMRGNWARRTITQDWLTKGMIHAHPSERRGHQSLQLGAT